MQPAFHLLILLCNIEMPTITLGLLFAVRYIIEVLTYIGFFKRVGNSSPYERNRGGSVPIARLSCERGRLHETAPFKLP